MKQVAIWKDHKVVGYCMMNEETRDFLNGIPNAGVYYGSDKRTRGSIEVEAAISFEVNNGGTLALKQEKHDGAVNANVLFPDGDFREFAISPGDFVMLMNYYRYQKERGEPIL